MILLQKKRSRVAFSNHFIAMKKMDFPKTNQLVKTCFGLLVVFLMVGTLSSCKKCKGEQPRARITNNGTKVASVQIKTTDGNTENINNVAPGTSSDYKSYAAGEITFTITVDKVNYVKAVILAD